MVRDAMALNTLEDLFEYQLRSAYYVERRLTDALDELQTSATNDRLVDAFAQHRDETEQQVERLEAVFDRLGIRAEEESVPTLDGLLQEKREFDSKARNEELQNLFYNEAGRKTERFELTMYEGLLALADRLDADEEVVDLLEQNRQEEQAAFEKLESISEGSAFESVFDRLL